MSKEWKSQRAKRYYFKNKEKCIAAAIKWRKENLEKAKKNSLNFKEKIYKIIVELKSNPCSDCGNKFLPCAMDFDHIKGKKTFSLNSMRSEKSMLEEIAKCELVCANCHRIRTYTRNKIIITKAEFVT